MNERALKTAMLVVACVAAMFGLAVPGNAGGGGANAQGGSVAERWSAVLERHVRDGGVDYAGVAAERPHLDAYLRQIADAEAAEWSSRDRLAFYVNAYNAVTIYWVLDGYPNIASVRDVDGFFNRREYRVAGRAMTLDEIEQEALALGDPRVHFAVVCASEGCPSLRNELYDADRLELQLADQTQAFLADSAKGLRFDEEAQKLWLSSIFKWYAQDFTGGTKLDGLIARGKLLLWLDSRLPKAVASKIRSSQPSVSFLDYDWRLNDRGPADRK